MQLPRLIFICLLLVIISGCSYYADMNGSVVDGATGRPLEGALVVAQWHETRGIPGFQYSDLHKSIETVTDKEGAFSIEGAFGFLLEPPRMLIYKAGYIPWRNDMVFPGGHLSNDNEWKHNITYKLDALADAYNYRQLNSFLSYGIKVSGNLKTPNFDDLMHEISGLEQSQIEKQMQKVKSP